MSERESRRFESAHDVTTKNQAEVVNLQGSPKDVSKSLIIRTQRSPKRKRDRSKNRGIVDDYVKKVRKNRTGRNAQLQQIEESPGGMRDPDQAFTVENNRSPKKYEKASDLDNSNIGLI